MANRRFNQFYNTLHKMPVRLDCNFIVDSTNGNGFGARSLKGAGIQNVFMNTSASITGTVATSANAITSIAQGTGSLNIGMSVQGTGIPAGTVITGITSSSAVAISQTPTGNHSSETITYQGIGSTGIVNPNPAAGNIMVVFEDLYQYYIGGYSGFIPPVSGSAILVASAGVTAGTAYTIVSVGTTTTAGWVSLGLPVGTVPAVGATFIATVTGTAAGTGAVEVPATGYSAIDHIEVVGDPNQTINAQIASSSFTLPISYLICACLFEGALTAPANGTVIGMSFEFQNSQIQNQGY
jgi:hypothetical protein